MQSIVKQASSEALWAFGLTLIYLIGWCLFAYFSPQGRGFLGFPWWFELSCLYLPLGFCAFITFIIHFFFQDLNLESATDFGKSL